MIATPAPPRLTELSPPATNARLKTIASEHLLRTTRLEDGELVIRLRGRARGGWPSDHPHAGLWSDDTMYVLVPTEHPSRRAHGARELLPRLVDHSGDSAVLLLGNVEDILTLITTGPDWCRARKTWRASEEVKARLADHRHTFKKENAASAA